MFDAKSAAMLTEITKIENDIKNAAIKGSRVICVRNISDETKTELINAGYKVDDNSNDRRRVYNEFYISW